MLATRAADAVVRARLRQPGRRPGRAGLRRRLDRGRRRRRAGRPGRRSSPRRCSSSTSTSGRCSASGCSTRGAGSPPSRSPRSSSPSGRRRPTPTVDAGRDARRSTRSPRSTRRSCSARATTSRKNGFTDVVLGLSGGIDSSLVACIAADALGPEHVHARRHAVALLERGLAHRRRGRWPTTSASTTALIAIEDAFAAFLELLAPSFDGREPDLTEENLQSRIRGDAADGAVEQVRLAGAHHRQQERDGRRLLHALRRHGRRLRRHQGRAEAARLRALPRTQRAGRARGRSPRRCSPSRRRPSCAPTSATTRACRPTRCSTRSSRPTSRTTAPRPS